MTFGAPESDDYSGRHVDVFVDGERLQAGIVIEDADRAGGAKCATHEDAPLGAAAGRRWDRLEDAMREVAEALGPTPHGPTAVAAAGGASDPGGTPAAEGRADRRGGALR